MVSPAAAAVTQNGMIVYPAGIYGGQDIAYYPPGQLNLATNARPIFPSKVGALRTNRNPPGAPGRPANNRSSYLGYSAGKATYGRYYSKNNSEKLAFEATSGAAVVPGTEMIASSAPIMAADPNMVQMVSPLSAAPNPYSGVPAIAAASVATATYPYAATSPASSIPKMIPTAAPTAAPVPQAAPGNSEAVLEDVCKRYMWGTPSYQLLTATGPESKTLYLFKVLIPAVGYFQVSYH